MVGIEMAPATMAFEGLLATPAAPAGAAVTGAGGFGELLGSVLVAGAEPDLPAPAAPGDRPPAKDELDVLMASLLGMRLARPAVLVPEAAAAAGGGGNAAAIAVRGAPFAGDGQAAAKVTELAWGEAATDGMAGPVPEPVDSTTAPPPAVHSATDATAQAVEAQQAVAAAIPGLNRGEHAVPELALASGAGGDGPAPAKPNARTGTAPPDASSEEPLAMAGSPGAEAISKASDGVVRTDGNATSTGTAANTSTPSREAPPAGGRWPQSSAGGTMDASAESASSAATAANATPPNQATAAASAADVAAPEGARGPATAPTEQVVRAVVEKVHEGGGRAVVRLDPPELGHVEVRVSTNHGSVHVDVLVERPEALSLLRGGAPDLQAMLQGRGLDLGNVNVGLGGGYLAGGSNAGGQDQPRQQRPQPGAFASILGVDTNAAVAGHNRLRATYNPDGRVLYRV